MARPLGLMIPTASKFVVPANGLGRAQEQTRPLEILRAPSLRIKLGSSFSRGGRHEADNAYAANDGGTSL